MVKEFVIWFHLSESKCQFAYFLTLSVEYILFIFCVIYYMIGFLSGATAELLAAENGTARYEI